MVLCGSLDTSLKTPGPVDYKKIYIQLRDWFSTQLPVKIKPPLPLSHTCNIIHQMNNFLGCVMKEHFSSLGRERRMRVEIIRVCLIWCCSCRTRLPRRLWLICAWLWWAPGWSSSVRCVMTARSPSVSRWSSRRSWPTNCSARWPLRVSTRRAVFWGRLHKLKMTL